MSNVAWGSRLQVIFFELAQLPQIIVGPSVWEAEGLLSEIPVLVESFPELFYNSSSNPKLVTI